MKLLSRLAGSYCGADRGGAGRGVQLTGHFLVRSGLRNAPRLPVRDSGDASSSITLVVGGRAGRCACIGGYAWPSGAWGGWPLFGVLGRTARGAMFRGEVRRGQSPGKKGERKRGDRDQLIAGTARGFLRNFRAPWFLAARGMSRYTECMGRSTWRCRLAPGSIAVAWCRLAAVHGPPSRLNSALPRVSTILPLHRFLSGGVGGCLGEPA